jgi:hypothetical protein
MKIAYIVTGQPRFLKEGSIWTKQKLFNFPIDIDYYCHFWDNGDPNLKENILSTWMPKKFQIDNYDEHFNNFYQEVHAKNKNCPNLHLFPKDFQDSHLLVPELEHISPWSKNFYGQWLSTSLGSNLLDINEYSEYDIVIKTRSDVIINLLPPSTWYRALGNIIKNPHFCDAIFPQWMHGDSKGIFLGDFTFIARSSIWLEYGRKMKNNLVELITDKKLYLYDISDSVLATHYLWQKLGRNAKAKWLSFQVVWPMSYKTCLWRENNHLSVNNSSYQEINNWYDKYEAGERAQ